MRGMRIVARNLTATPLTVDEAGHQLGAGEFGVVDEDDEVTAGLLAAGNLGKTGRPDDGVDVDPGAAAAFKQLGSRAPAPAQPPAEDDAGDDETTAAAKTTAGRKATR